MAETDAFTRVRPDAGTAAPIRLIPDYDNILLAHADRTRIMPEGRHLGMFSSNGVMQGALLVDGYVRAMWRPNTDKGASTLLITPFGKALPRSQQPAIAEEARALLEFLTPADKHDVQFGPAKP